MRSSPSGSVHEPSAPTVCGGWSAIRRPHRHRLARRFPASAAPLGASIAALVFALSAARSAPTSAAPDGIQGAGGTRLVVVNRDRANEAVVVADFYKQSAGAAASISVLRPAVPPWGTTDFAYPTELSNGAYAVIVSSDRLIRPLSVTRWPTSGGYIAEDAPEPGQVVLVPLALLKYKGHSSLVSIQNTDTGQVAVVSVDLLAAGDGTPVATKSYIVQPGSSVTIDLSKDPAFVGVQANTPDGFLGSMRVTCPIDVAVHAIHDVETSQRAVYDFDGVPIGDAASKLHVLLVAEGPARDPDVAERGWIAVQNAGDAPASVQVAYRGVGGSCDGQSFVHGPRTLAPLTMTLFDTAADDVPAATLPAGCLASASITSDGGPLAAAVVHLVGVGSANGVARTAATLAMPSAAAAGDWLLWRWHRPWAPDGGISEAIVHNPGATDATVDLTPRDDAGVPVTDCGAPCHAVIPPGGTHRFVAADQNALAMQFSGSAVVHADAPVLVWLRQSYNGGGGDETLSAAVTLSGAASGGRAHVPLYLRAAGPATSPALTATALPTETPDMPPTETPQPTETPAAAPTDTPIPTETLEVPPLETPATATPTSVETSMPTETPDPLASPAPTISSVPPLPTETPPPAGPTATAATATPSRTPEPTQTPPPPTATRTPAASATATRAGVGRAKVYLPYGRR